MALPKLNDVVQYEMTIPSSNKKVRFRPFLVKEEKNLMIAMESNDNRSIMHTLLKTLKSCVEDDISVSKLCTFDVEYMFLQIRSKSVGETSKVNMICSGCNKSSEVKINIDDINIEVPDVEKTVQLTDKISVELDWPTYASLSELNLGQTTNTEELFKVTAQYFKSINTEEERIDTKDVSSEELQEFIDSMSASQFAKVKDFVEQMPSLKHDIEFECDHCQHHNKITLEGLAGFLS